MVPKTQAQNFGAFFERLDQSLDDYDVRSYGVSMSNLEDVFLKINQEFAPDLFGDLHSFDHSRNSSNLSIDQGKIDNFAHSVGHSTVDKSKKNNESDVGSSDEENSMDNS